MSYNLNNLVAERKTKAVYKDGDKVIKLFVENYSKANILNEALNQARVEENTNLNIPKLEEVTKINGRWAIVSEYIEGKTLAEYMQENPEKLDEYLELFVNIQLEVLDNKVTLLNRIKDKFKRKITNSTELDDATKFELLQKLEGMKNHAKLCHGDFNPSNIILKPDGSYYVIDWSHVTQGNASADAARTFVLFSIDHKVDVAEKYLKLFAQKSGIEIKHIQTWIPIVAATQLMKGVEKEQEILRKWVDVVEYE
ncbi:MAG: phosphotransferase [Clostridia bacterium]|nr:phosphotransferase [Clostridia bacterium]